MGFYKMVFDKGYDKMDINNTGLKRRDAIIDSISLFTDQMSSFELFNNGCMHCPYVTNINSRISSDSGRAKDASDKTDLPFV